MYLCSVYANMGQPQSEVFIIRLKEAKAGWKPRDFQ